MDTRFHGDSMSDGSKDVVRSVENSVATNVDVLDHLGDAVAQEQPGGLSSVVANEVEVRPTGAPGSDAKGIREAQLAAALQAAMQRGTGTGWLRPVTFGAPMACYTSRYQSYWLS